MLNMQINGRPAQARAGETILQALDRAGVKVPTLCHVPGLAPTGACRLCMVELEANHQLVPACSYPVAEGMAVGTRTPTVLEARRTILELLLSNHPDDCLYCLRNGHCDLQRLAQEHGIDQRLYRGKQTQKPLDASGPALIRDPEKCILCGRCVRVCEEIQTVSAIDFVGRGCNAYVGTAFDRGLNVSSCIFCGQCVRACPTGALVERSQVREVLRALADPEAFCVVQHAPAVSVTVAEEFGLKPGADVDGKMVAALRSLGFKRVFDTSFTADLTIMEEGSELVQRIQTGGVLPMMTSCSPGWIKFVEQFYPEFIPNLSTCKSPQQMMGALIKSFVAEREGIPPQRIVSVSIMPCTAKKFECARPEMGQGSVADVDIVLTTRELAQLLRLGGIDLTAVAPEAPDNPFGERSSAGKLFGATGGVMEAAVRSAHWLLTGRNLRNLRVEPLRGLDGCKEMTADLGGVLVRAAVVSGLGNARKLLEEVRAGRRQLHFIEVMTCPGGCINGGGQPLSTTTRAVKARMKRLYDIDRDEALRLSHENPWVKRLYDEFLGQPLGEKSHHLLHTQYAPRDVVL
ncbi:MAG: NADH-dependent [FeFe] hydrogenase, group A6 [Candidatus Krumholzibacteriia bacterium]